MKTSKDTVKYAAERHEKLSSNILSGFRSFSVSNGMIARMSLIPSMN
jgi:hypothetical protein